VGDELDLGCIFEREAHRFLGSHFTTLVHAALPLAAASRQRCYAAVSKHSAGIPVREQRSPSG